MRLVRQFTSSFRHGQLDVARNRQQIDKHLNVTHYILPPNQPNVGAAYYDYFRHPLQPQADEQRYSTQPTATPTPAPTATCTPTSTRPSASVFLPMIVRN